MRTNLEIERRLRWHNSDKTFIILECGSMKWKVTPYKMNSPPPNDMSVEYIGIDVEFISDYKTSNLWAIDTEISVKATEIYGTKVEKQMDCHFGDCSTTVNFGKFMIEQDLVPRPSELNWIQREFWWLFFELLITAKIRIKSCIGIELPFNLTDFSMPKSIDSEIMLITDDGRRFFANRYVLQRFSSVFRLKCKDCDEIRIEIDDIEHFSDFLRLIYGENQHMSDENVEGILKLATEYEVEFMIQDIEEYLIITKEVTNENKLRMAELYKLPKLQTEVSMKISIEEKLKEFTKEKVMNMNNKAVRTVLSRMCI